MQPLLSSTALANIRKVGESMMTTPVMILRSTIVAVGETGYDPVYPYGDAQSQYDYGDDAMVPIDFGETPPSEAIVAGADGTLKGWFVSRLQSEIQQTTAELATVDTHIVRLPVGTDVRVDDTLRANGSDYHVVDANEDDTWPEWLKVLVRRAE